MQNFTIISLEVITMGKTIFITETSSGLENIITLLLGKFVQFF
jgi:hypothetical protein